MRLWLYGVLMFLMIVFTGSIVYGLDENDLDVVLCDDGGIVVGYSGVMPLNETVDLKSGKVGLFLVLDDDSVTGGVNGVLGIKGCNCESPVVNFSLRGETNTVENKSVFKIVFNGFYKDSDMGLEFVSDGIRFVYEYGSYNVLVDGSVIVGYHADDSEEQLKNLAEFLSRDNIEGMLLMYGVRGVHVNEFDAELFSDEYLQVKFSLSIDLRELNTDEDVKMNLTEFDEYMRNITVPTRFDVVFSYVNNSLVFNETVSYGAGVDKVNEAWRDFLVFLKNDTESIVEQSEGVEIDEEKLGELIDDLLAIEFMPGKVYLNAELIDSEHVNITLNGLKIRKMGCDDPLETLRLFKKIISEIEELSDDFTFGLKGFRIYYDGDMKIGLDGKVVGSGEEVVLEKVDDLEYINESGLTTVSESKSEGEGFDFHNVLIPMGVVVVVLAGLGVYLFRRG